MEKKNNSYFKHLIKSMDVLISVFVGVVIAACLWLIDLKDVFYTMKPTYAYWLQAIYNGAVVATVVGCFVALYPTLKEKSIVRGDALLVVLTSLSVVSAVLFGINGNVVACVLWAIAVIISVIYFASRCKEFDANEKSENLLNTKGYYATIARKYNFVLLILVGFVLAVIALISFNNTDLLKGVVKYYVVGVAVVAFVGAIIQPLVCKNTKVGVIDALLVVVLAFAVFFSPCMIASPFKLRFAFVYLAFTLGVAFALVFRSIFVSSNVDAKVAKKGLPNYHGVVFAKYGAFVPVLFGIVAGVCCTLVTRYGRIIEVFDHARPALFGIIAFVITVTTLVVIVKAIVKKGYTSTEANSLDAALVTAFVGSLAGYGMMFTDFSWKRLVLVLIPFVFSIVSMIIRSRKIEVVSQVAEAENDDIVVDVKLVIDGDEIKAYCDGAEVEVTVVNKTPAKEEAPAVEEKVEEAVVEEPVAEEVAPVVDTEDKLIIAKRSFENKIKFASPKAKNYYSELKNALMVYKTKARVSKKAEAFRKNGLLAKISVSGKSIRLHLALDPLAYDENKYHHDDLGSKRAFKEVPFTMKIRSDLACKRAIELIDELAQSRGLKANKKYERVNYAEGLDIDGAAILEKLGLYDLLTEVATKQQAENLTDEVLNFIPIVTLPKTLNEESENVYLDTELKYLEDTISAETLHEASRIPATVDIINVKARTGLDKKITVVADEIDPLAAKLVILTGGKVFKVVRK